MRDDIGLEKPTISEILEMRLTDLRIAGKARAENTPSIQKRLRRHFGDVRPDEVTPDRIRAYWAVWQHVAAGLREELQELKTSLRMALKRGLIAHLSDIEIPQRPPQETLLSREAGQALRGAAHHPHFRLYLLIALTTGARKGAILELTWARVDFARRRIDFQDPALPITNKRRAIMPVHQTVMAILAKAKETAQTAYVIEYKGTPVKSIRTAFAKAARRAGLPQATPHILKHSVISWLAEDGYTIDQLSDMTATHPNTVRRVYRKVSPDYLSDLAESLSQCINFGATKVPDLLK